MIRRSRSPILTSAVSGKAGAMPQTGRRMRGLLRPGLVSGAALLLTGCVGFSGDGGMASVVSGSSASIDKEVVRISDDQSAAAAKEGVDRLLRQQLTADAAVQVALLNNRGLQAAFNRLGVAEAQMVAASLPPNPRFGISKLSGRFEVEIERQIVGNLLALATLPARAEIARDQFGIARRQTVEAVLKLAADTRRQYWRAVAANAEVAFYQQAKATATATTELFRRLGESGGVNKIDQAREFAFDAELTVQLAEARRRQGEERERLVRQLGLWGADARFRLPSALPPTPRPQTAKAIEAEALRQRVDMQIARNELALLARSLGLTQAVRFINDAELLGRRTYDRGREITGVGSVQRDTARSSTLELDIEIPIYDFGQSKVAMAEQTYMQAANRLAEKAVNVRSEAREAYASYRASYDIVRQYQNNVLPLRKIIQDESLLQYNGMLTDVTELLTDARNRILSNVAAINARRDFWIAHTNFRHALIGGGVGGDGAAAEPALAAAGAAAGH